MQGVQTDGNVIPTARVAQGDVPVVVHATGDFRPLKAQALVAPAVGGPMQILTIAATGTPVKEGDVIVEFDQSEQEERLETANRSSRRPSRRSRRCAPTRSCRAHRTRSTLLTARFDVRRGELDVQGSELHSTIDKQKFVLTLEEAKGRLAQLQDDLKSRTASDRASLAVLEEKRNKARLQMDNAQRNIDNMRLRAPFDGLVAVKSNDMNNAAWAGVVVPEFRSGDTVYPGRPVAEVLHRVGHRAHRQGERIRSRAPQRGSEGGSVDSCRAGQDLAGDDQGGGGRQPARGVGVERSDADVRCQLRRDGQQSCESASGPDDSGARHWRADQGRAVLPRQALFEHDGKPVVFVRQGRSFEPREVKVSHRTETHIVVTNLPAGTEVALRNPLADEKKGPGNAGPVQPRAGS